MDLYSSFFIVSLFVFSNCHEILVAPTPRSSIVSSTPSCGYGNGLNSPIALEIYALDYMYVNWTVHHTFGRVRLALTPYQSNPRESDLLAGVLPDLEGNIYHNFLAGESWVRIPFSVGFKTFQFIWDDGEEIWYACSDIRVLSRPNGTQTTGAFTTGSVTTGELTSGEVTTGITTSIVETTPITTSPIPATTGISCSDSCIDICGENNIIRCDCQKGILGSVECKEETSSSSKLIFHLVLWNILLYFI